MSSYPGTATSYIQAPPGAAFIFATNFRARFERTVMISDKNHLSAGVITSSMRTVPTGQQHLPRWTRLLLQELTADLIMASPDAGAEYKRFLDIRHRELPVPKPDLAGATVLVTGGTGCIGRTLLGQLHAAGAARLVSVSRGVTRRWRNGNVGYRYADIRDRTAMVNLITQVKPDAVFHVAAQRDPGLASREVHRTVTTNVMGTRNVLTAAADAGVPRLVYASTGKALRPYSPEIYTASKKAAEYICAEIARTSGMLVSAGRFTHVIDNSIIHARLQAWAQNPDAVIRLHQPDIVFYVQSAIESAQLLLAADGAQGELRIHAISDLGWPVSLLDVTLAILAQSGSSTPIYFSGYDEGYENPAPEDLYDPAVSWNASPLINGCEARQVVDNRCPATSAFRFTGTGNPRAGKQLAQLAAVCEETRDSDKIRGALDQLSQVLRTD